MGFTQCPVSIATYSLQQHVCIPHQVGFATLGIPVSFGSCIDITVYDSYSQQNKSNENGLSTTELKEDICSTIRSDFPA